MRSDNHFVVLLFFSLLSLVGTTIFSSIIISKTNGIKAKIES